MKIALFSDSHDRRENLQWAIEQTISRGITEALHLGDFCSPPVAMHMAESPLHWTCVWGNCDGDKLSCYRKVQTKGNVDFADGDFREHTVDGKKLFLTHYPQIARIAALSGQYDACFYGHDHEANSELVNSVLYANPGEIAGTKTGKVSFAIYDTETNSIEHIWM